MDRRRPTVAEGMGKGVAGGHADRVGRTLITGCVGPAERGLLGAGRAGTRGKAGDRAGGRKGADGCIGHEASGRACWQGWEQRRRGGRACWRLWRDYM